MDTFNIHEAKTHLSKLIERVAAGEEVVIAKAGKPVAKLVPYTENKEPRKIGAWKGKVWLAPDWDSDETNEEIARLFYGEDDE
jgi:prevent-host-death family protein